jgi:hypothetical protein
MQYFTLKKCFFKLNDTLNVVSLCSMIIAIPQSGSVERAELAKAFPPCPIGFHWLGIAAEWIVLLVIGVARSRKVV